VPLNDFFAGHRIIISRFAVVIFFSFLAVSLSGWRAIDPSFVSSLSRMGWILIALAVTGRLWCGSHISGKKNTTLVTSGPYSVCRNPLYFFSFLGGLGAMILTNTFLFPLLFSALFAFYYARVIACEEAVLLNLYGTDYKQYCFNVPRFWPKLSRIPQSLTSAVSTTHFFKNLGEVSWFMVAGGGVQYLEYLHLSNTLPTLLLIY